ncbi:MAG: hypothetical protein ACI9FG_001494 [Crocinitomicaceae bacterium]|jgi:hypothetical protein
MNSFAHQRWQVAGSVDVSLCVLRTTRPLLDSQFELMAGGSALVEV